MRSQLARDEALSYAAQSETAIAQINALHDEPTAPDRSKRIARLHQDVGLYFKLGELHALLAISEAVDALTVALRPGSCQHLVVDHAIGACVDCGRDS